MCEMVRFFVWCWLALAAKASVVCEADIGTNTDGFCPFTFITVLPQQDLIFLMTVWENVGISLSKTEQLSGTFASSSPFIQFDPFVLPHVSSLPNFNGCVFFLFSFGNYCCMCCILMPQISLCLVYFLGWPDPQKGSSKILEILYPKVKRGSRRRCEDITSNEKCWYFYCLFALLKAMNLFH